MDLVVKSAISNWDRVSSTEMARGVETRFADLVTRQSRFVFRLAYSVLRNADDAEDVVQETFLKLFKNRSWLDMQDERAFLARTAWRIAIGRKRPNSAGLEDRGGNATPETLAIEDQRSRQIHALIDSLPERLREPLMLSALQDLTTAQIATALDKPEGTIRRRISEARDLLRQKLERMNHHAG